MAVFPIIARRTSELLVHQRLLGQLQFDQLELLRLQDQVSTGRRFTSPSDDAPAAQRGIQLQRVLEQREQSKTNLEAGRSFLTASETALSGTANLLARIRGLSLTVANTTSTDGQRASVVLEVKETLNELLRLANSDFRGRYLFAGSDSSAKPFGYESGAVVYSGNETELGSFADQGVLFRTSIPGSEVFGALSAEVQSAIDLNPVLKEGTRLADLRGGQGIKSGSIRISDGTSTSLIDLAGAATIGDVARRIEANPPSGREVTVRISPTGLVIDLDDAGGGNLTIREVGSGTTAAELGILNSGGTGTAPLIGADLNPSLRLTTRIADVLGTRASAIVSFPGDNNDLILEAAQNGAAQNGTTIQFVDDSLLQAAPGLSAGNETVAYTASATAPRAALTFSGTNNNLVLSGQTPGTSLNNVRIEVAAAGAIGNTAQVNYDGLNKVLTIGVDSGGATQIQTVINAVAAEGTFSAAYDASDPVDGGFVATAAVSAADAGVVQGNTGNSGAAANTISVHVAPGATRASDVITAIQADATVSSLFTVRLDAKDTAFAASAGQGLIDVNGTAVAAGGSGLSLDQTAGVQVTSGTETHVITFAGAETIEDLLNAFSSSPAGVLAEINDSRTGINVRSRASGTNFTIGENGGATAEQLGLRTFTRQTQLADLNFGRGVAGAAGTDFTITRNDGVALDIDVSGATTIGDVIDLINGHPANQDPDAVTARLVQFGNGIEIVDDTPGGGSLSVDRSFLSFAAWDLGLIARGQDSAAAAVAGGSEVLTGSDVNPLETAGVFNTLLRLQGAIETFDLGEIERTINLLDEDLSRLTFVRGELGAEQRGLDVLQQRLGEEEVELRRSLSVDIDVDLVEAISELTSRQAAFEASLALVGRTSQLTLLNFV